MTTPYGGDPCCGLSLYRAIKVIAIIDLMTSIFSTVLALFGFIIALVDGEAILNEVNNDYNGNGTVVPDGNPHIGGYYSIIVKAGLLIISLLAITLLNVLYIFLARYLLYATQERNAFKLQRWFDVTAVILAIRLVGYIPLLFVEGGGVIIFGMVWCAYSGYSLWVVHTFKTQLLTETEGESRLLRDSIYYSKP